jgi:hypothetical protein
MWENYARILGHNAVSILSRTTKGGPFTINFCDPLWERPACELAVRIDFEGVLAADRKKVGGYMVCGVARFADIKPLLADIAASLGLSADVLETATGPQDILDELFNIVMGVTGADWAEHGFEMDFSTPRNLSGRPLPPPSPDDLAFQRLAVSDKAGLKVDILIVFSGLGRPAV